jgi:hypothetical protein
MPNIAKQATIKTRRQGIIIESTPSRHNRKFTHCATCNLRLVGWAFFRDFDLRGGLSLVRESRREGSANQPS